METAVNTGAWHAIVSASPVVQFTLLTLVAMSVTTWAVVLSKWRLFTSVTAANQPILEKFWKATSLDEVFNALDTLPDSPAANIFRAGYLELRKIAESKLAKGSAEGSTPFLTGLDNLERALKKSIDKEVSQLENRLTILATTGSSGPFIGLFGTVWGIMSAFQKIAETKVANIAVVAPGIAEALIATGVGLAAAIPASIFYNHFVNQLKKQELELNSFAADFLNIAKRNFFKGD